MSETFIYSLITHFTRVQPFVVTRRRYNADLFPYEKVFAPASRNVPYENLFEPVLRKFGFDPPIKKILLSTIKNNQIKLVHAHFGPDGYDVVHMDVLGDLPFICSFYGYDASSCARIKKWRVRYRKLFGRGNTFLVEGTQMRQRLLDLGCPISKVHLIRIGVDADAIPFRARSLSSKPVIILFCGRFVEKKGLLHALQAIQQLNLKSGHIEFRIIGDGVLRPQVIRFVKDHDLRDRVTLLGYLPHDKVKEEMQRCDILFQPSLTASDGDAEGGAPTILIEAQAAGIPVVSTNHADIPEIVVNGETGLLAQEGDVNDIADKLDTMLKSHHKWAEYGKRGREHVIRQHNIKQITSDLEELYFHILKDKT